MRELAEDVWHVALTPRDGINAYVLGDVLVDAGIRPHGGRLVRMLAGRAIAAHALTHAHPDHAGGSKAVVDALGVPLWAPAGDAPAVERGRTVAPDGPLKGVMERLGGFPAAPVARRLQAGDEIGPGFVVLDTPGHSPGHVSFWRERDRVLICGDVWFNMDPFTTRPGLRPPFSRVTVDVARNTRSQRELTDLQPDVVGFGHGPVMTGAAAKLQAF